MSSDHDSDQGFLKQLFITVKEAVESLPGRPDVSPLLIVDDLSILTSLGYKGPDVAVFFQDLQTMLCARGGCFVCLIHTELIDTRAESRPNSLYCYIGHQSDMLITVRPLRTGYCRDLSGEVSIHDNSSTF